MEDQYYRKSKPKFKSWLNKTLRKKNVLVTLLVTVPAFSFMFFSNKGIIQRLSLEAEKKAEQQVVDKLIREQKKLQALNNKLDSDRAAIEKAAREKWKWVKQGEILYLYKSEEK